MLDLPRFEDGKRLTCPPNTLISELIQFLSGKLAFEKFFLQKPQSFDPL
jgi:hypothetical protein